MPSKQPMVSVCMIAYNVEKYIEQAIEGVLRQETDFPVELVIGEDCSTDATRVICEQYARQYPDRITYLPNPVNQGIGKNHYRTLMSCQGKYVAVCDSDDVWIDPHKLQYQVDFLEKNPDYGLVYSDIECINENGDEVDWNILHQMRPRYAEGDVFFKLLQGNFINNCTVVFRRELIDDYQGYINPICHDWLLWMRIAARTKIHFYNARTTYYRLHAGGVTSSRTRIKQNVKLVLPQLQDVMLYFHKVYNKPLSKSEKALFFRKLLSLLLRLESYKDKIPLLYILPYYLPKARTLLQMITSKFKKEKEQPLVPPLELRQDSVIQVPKDAPAI